MSSNIFFTKWSKISGDRFDPLMVLYKKTTQAFKYETVAFKDLLLSNPMYGANEAGVERTDENEPRYIRITDIDEFGNLKDGLGVTAQVIEDKYFLNENDLLFARSGATVGKAYIHRKRDYECFFAGYMIRFIVDNNIINPFYVFLYTQLNIYKKWVLSIQRAAGQPNINAEEYKSLPIPIPPKEIQQEIVNKIQDAYKQKQQKEDEAKKLLNSIDEYLLQELGINLPKIEESDISKRVFLRKWSEISGDRFDSNGHQEKFEVFRNLLCKYPTLKFRELVLSIKTGLPIRKDNRIENGLYPYYGANGIIGYMDEYTNDGLFLIVGQDGYIGNHYVVNGKFWASNHNWVAEIKEQYNVYFIKEVLDIINYDYLITGGVIPKLTKEALESIMIPIPSLLIQEEIVSHITNIREQVKILKQQAIDDFEKAKKEVEDILLKADK